MENLIGFFFFFLSGVLFGLFGAGGSLITIPILIVFFDLPFKISTTYSLIIVFLVSLFGVLRKKKAYSYNFNSIFYLGIFSLIGVLFSRNFLFKIIPEKLLLSTFVIFLFLTGLILAIKSSKQNLKKKSTVKLNLNLFFTLIQGLFLGIFTGLLGVGGGFLIVPTLIFFQKLNIKQAASASIFLIFLNSWLAILIDFSNNYFHLNISLLLTIILFALLGFFVGKKIQNSVNLKMAQKLFALFLIIISLFTTFNFKLFL
tara:strand:- start:2851 stop:3624 length:774 start_codon:yes stop_codon:yes gene_type:complete